MLPFTTFRGHIKQVKLSQMEAGAAKLVEQAFPKFFAEVPWKETDRQILQMLALLRSNSPDRYRRFSGCLRGLSVLPPSRYYSVCRDETGDDGETLVGELQAYVGIPQGTVISILDLAHMETALLVGKDAPEQTLRLCLLHLPQTPKTIFQRIAMRIRRTQVLAQQLDVPYCVQRVEIDDVVDLRVPDSRRRFWQYFRSGDGRYFRTSAATEAGVDNFFAAWATLCDIATGGNWMTDAIGAALRSLGANGLVYPSARVNHYVEVRGGEVVDFSGWNFLDYRDSGASPSSETPQMRSEYDGPWGAASLPGVKLTFAPDDSEYAGTFSVSGLREGLSALRNLKASQATVKLGHEYDKFLNLAKEIDSMDAAAKAAALGVFLQTLR